MQHFLPIGARVCHSDDYVKVGNSLHGHGLYANNDLPLGFMCGPYSGEHITDSEAELEEQVNNRYLFRLPNGVNLNAQNKNCSTILRWVNCAMNYDQQNCRFTLLNNEPWLKLIKPVSANSELFGWYGRDSNRIIALQDCKITVTRPWIQCLLRNNNSIEDFLIKLITSHRVLEESVSNLEELLAQATQKMTSIDKVSHGAHPIMTTTRSTRPCKRRPIEITQNSCWTTPIKKNYRATDTDSFLVDRHQNGSDIRNNTVVPWGNWSWQVLLHGQPIKRFRGIIGDDQKRESIKLQAESFLRQQIVDRQVCFSNKNKLSQEDEIDLNDAVDGLQMLRGYRS